MTHENLNCNPQLHCKHQRYFWEYLFNPFMLFLRGTEANLWCFCSQSSCTVLQNTRGLEKVYLEARRWFQMWCFFWGKHRTGLFINGRFHFLYGYQDICVVSVLHIFKLYCIFIVEAECSSCYFTVLFQSFLF